MLIRLAAAFLPQTVFWPLAAVFVLVLLAAVLRRRRGYAVLIPAACLAALCLHQVEIFRMQPLLELDNTCHMLTVRVEKTWPGNREDIVQANLLVQEMDGKRFYPGSRFGIHCSGFPEAQPGELFTGRFRLSALEKNRYRQRNLADGVYLESRPEHLVRAACSGAPKFWFCKLRETLAQSVRRYLPKAEGAVLAAMTLGDKSALTPRLQDAYRKAGVSHLLVVSGLHLSLLCGALLGTRALGGKHPKRKVLFAMGMVLFLVMLTGQSASISRAGTAAMVYYFGLLMFRAADAITSLGVAAFFASLAGPYAVFDLGLQLSFSATLGIILGGFWVKPLRDKANMAGSFKYRLAAGMAEAVVCPLMAALFTLPVQLGYGLSVSGVSVLTNLLVMLLVGPVLVLGFLTAFTGLVPGLAFAAKTFALLAGCLVRLMNHIVFACAQLPFAEVFIPAAFSLALWGILLGALLLLHHYRCRKIWWPCLIFAVVPGILLHACLTAGTVKLCSGGNSNDPSLIVQQQGHSIVILRGNEDGARKLRGQMERMGMEKATLLIDLRDQPNEGSIPAKWKMSVADFEQNTTRSWKICDIMTTSYRMKTGRMVLLDIEGYKIAVTEGECRLAEPLQVDLMLAGWRLPTGIRAEITAGRADQEWPSEPDGRIYLISDEFHAVVRPENMAMLYGGSYAS